MISFIVLTPPGGPDRDHRSTRFVADRFCWLAFVFPGLWLLFHRCWLFGLSAIAAQVLVVWLTQQPDLYWVRTLLELSIGLLVGLEGRNIHVRNLKAKGWSIVDIVTAPDLATAEAFYFSGLPAEPMKPSLPATDWTKRSRPLTAPARGGPALGLFDMGGGR